MDESIIKLEHIDFYYDKDKPSEVHALTDVSISIKRGEFVSFFGSSGCGKSTLLYVISGIDQPKDGHVLVNGHDLVSFSQQEMALYRQMGIGLIFQNFNLIPSVTVIDNVMLPMAFLGLSESKRRERAHKILADLNISDFADRYPYELSGGQQQRVGIARALANDPPIILADEPTGNLDSANATKTLELLKELSEKHGKTVILVTHEAWSLQYVDTIFYMKDGKVTNTEKNTHKDVASAEGKGIDETKHYEKTLQGADISKIRAHALALLLFRGYSNDEKARAEEILLKRINGELDQAGLELELDKPFRKGGMGLWKQRAKRVAKIIEDAVREEYQLEKVHKKLKENPFEPVNEEIEDIRTWLLDGYGGRLSPYQIDRFQEAISERAQEIIHPEHFKRVLEMIKSEGGVGLSPVLASRVADRLEMLIAMDPIDGSQQ